MSIRPYKPADKGLYFKNYNGIDVKLIRYTLEDNGFREATDRKHEWTLMWACSNIKSVVYQNLTRYQKVNQTTFSLWHRRGLPAIESALVKNNNGGFKPLLSELTTTYLDWPEEEINPFFNINTPDDLSFAEAIICR